MLSRSDHHVIVEVDRALSRSFEWVFIVYPDVAVLGFSGNSGISEIG